MKTTFNKPLEYEQYYQKLGNDKDLNYFNSLKDVLVLSAVIGLVKNKSIPFTKSGGDSIKDHYIQDDMNLLDIISILSTDDIKILLEENRDEKYKLIEEYAHGGIQYIVENIFNGPITSTDKIIEFVLSFKPEHSEQRVDLGDMITNLVHELESEFSSSN